MEQSQPLPSKLTSSHAPATAARARVLDPGHTRYLLNAAISLVAFMGSMALVYLPHLIDYPVTRFLNGFANRSAFVDQLFFNMDTIFSFSGVPLMALAWFCWFDEADLTKRARIAVGTLVSFGAGVVSRFLQHVLSTHPRPFFDPALGFHRPTIGDYAPLNTWNSFPSDHATVFVGLAVAIYAIRPRLGLLAFVWLGFVESARIYEGAHYPTDLLGGAALGAGAVWAAQALRIPSWDRRLVAWERRSPGLFYMCAFFISFQIATLFTDLRNFGSGFSLLFK